MLFTGSPFCCEVVEIPSKKSSIATARGEGLSRVILGSAAYFEVNPHSPDHGPIEAQVIGKFLVRKRPSVPVIESMLMNNMPCRSRRQTVVNSDGEIGIRIIQG